MSALNEVDFSRASLLEDQSFIRELVSEAFWKWYENNTSMKIITVKVWFVKKDILVADLYSLFVILFGNPPA